MDPKKGTEIPRLARRPLFFLQPRTLVGTDPAALLATEPLLMQALLDQVDALQRSIATLEDALHEAYGEHEDAFIFESLPGSGRIHCARLLPACGTDRERFPTAADLLCHCGLAPILRPTGNRQNFRALRRRRACPVFLKQSFHEWAAQTLVTCARAKAFWLGPLKLAHCE